jgi:hypothetical protein
MWALKSDQGIVALAATFHPDFDDASTAGAKRRQPRSLACASGHSE